MTDKQQPAQFDWATELSDAQGHVTLSEQEAKEIGARLRRMGEKLKAYEDLDDAADDVQLLRMGYAAARLEIESLKVQSAEHAKEQADELAVAYMCGASREKELAAQQTATTYAALPDEREAFEAMMRSQTFDSLKRLSDGSYESYEARVGWLAWNVRASHGQAPAGATLPDGWVPLTITHEGQYPEEVAYGPQIMMDRLGKWLGKYFAQATECVPAPATPPECETEAEKRAFADATHTLRASHGQAPAQPAAVHCKGRNCAAVDGYGHSNECASDHERAASGLDTAGNRNPVARYDGYRGAPCNPAYTKDQRAAWLEGCEARNRQGITPSPQADNKKKDPL